MKSKLLLLISIIVCCGLSNSIKAQCTDDRAGKVGQFWIEKIVKECTSTPNLLKTTVTKCEYVKDMKEGIPGWKIWVKADWQGKYTTLKYNISLYIEELQKSGNSTGITTIYYTGYSNSLTFKCIDLANTRPVKISDGTMQHTPFKEFLYLAEVE